MKIENIKPMDIEKRSMEIIGETLVELGKTVDPAVEDIVKRVIHTSADFDYADNLYFSAGAVETISRAVEAGAVIVTDTTMAQSGINKRTLKLFGGEALCFIGDEDVAREAKERGVTRSSVSMEKAARLGRPVVFAIGNAPTALLRIEELYREGAFTPAGVIGVPVGFVNVVESKERMIASGLPCIVARGRKGGSNVAAAIVNAILYRMKRV